MQAQQVRDWMQAAAIMEHRMKEQERQRRMRDDYSASLKFHFECHTRASLQGIINEWARVTFSQPTVIHHTGNWGTEVIVSSVMRRLNSLALRCHYDLPVKCQFVLDARDTQRQRYPTLSEVRSEVVKQVARAYTPCEMCSTPGLLGLCKLCEPAAYGATFEDERMELPF